MRRLSRKCLRSGRLITHCHRARFLHPLLARTYYQTLPQLSVSTSLLVIRPFSSATVSDTPRHDSLDQDTGRREQKPPDTVQEVLDFWFGWEDWRERKTDTQKYRDAKFSFWFMGGREVDSQCKAFVPLIEAADKGKLQGHEWTSIDGLVAQIVLLDQLSRNCFRGTKRAYAYDTQAIKTAVILMDKIKDNPSDLPGAGLLFLSACLMHSEELALHAKLTGFIEASIVVSADESKPHL